MNWGQIAQERLADIATCSLPGPGVTRFPFTSDHRDALKVIGAWMARAGLEVSLDAAGTLVGRSAGAGAAVLIGSHQDSVRDAGRYDGIMGIALACLAIEKLRSDGVTLGYPVEVLAFADEEGVRFPTALLGPRALAGTFDWHVLDMVDAEGVPLRDAIDAFGGDASAIATLKRDPKDVRCYLEAHIEQGPVLQTRDVPVGIVTGICGIERNTVTFRGETGHAGTVPMEDRADALVAAADFISAVYDAARNVENLRATVGTCRLGPGVANGIPDRADLTLEIRTPDDAVREGFAAEMRGTAEACARHRGVRHWMERTYLQPAVPCAPGLRGLLFEAIEKTGHGGTIELPSGATHDASAMADLCDMAMLFVRCRDGVSHRPEEYASAEDMAVAIEVLANTLMALSEKP